MVVWRDVNTLRAELLQVGVFQARQAKASSVVEPEPEP